MWASVNRYNTRTVFNLFITFLIAYITNWLQRRILSGNVLSDSVVEFILPVLLSAVVAFIKYMIAGSGQKQASRIRDRIATLLLRLKRPRSTTRGPAFAHGLLRGCDPASSCGLPRPIQTGMGQEVTWMVQRSRRAGGFAVSGDGRGIEGRAGLALPVEVADRIGLTDALCEALGGVRSWRDHDPGVVARDLAVMLIDGGTCIDHLPSRHPDLFGPAASQPTAWRTIEAIAADELAIIRMTAALARVRG
jgi:hypothetical protein